MLQAGTLLLDRYQIHSLLGQGGMGAVYRAYDERLDIEVAVKEMTRYTTVSVSEWAQMRQQFQQEARILARLNHPNLVKVTDYAEVGTTGYLVMAFAEGETLEALIVREGRIDEERVMSWALPLLDALHYCHAQNVIHRDIKPANIIIRPNSSPLLIDFGLVKKQHATTTQTQSIIRGMGTPEYTPPEQYDQFAGSTDARSDLFSFGATLFHALTGEAPATVTSRVTNPTTFRPIQTLAPDTSKSTATAIMQALELDQSQRFATADQLKGALQVKEPHKTKLPLTFVAIGAIAALIIVAFFVFRLPNDIDDLTVSNQIVVFATALPTVPRDKEPSSAEPTPQRVVTDLPTAPSPVVATATDTPVPTSVPTETTAPTLTPMATPTATAVPLAVQTSLLFSSETYHLGDEDIEQDSTGQAWESLSGQCHTFTFMVSANTLINSLTLTLETYGAEAANTILQNGQQINTLPAQGQLSPNFWRPPFNIPLAPSGVIAGNNTLTICAAEITVGAEFEGDRDDFRIRNVQVISNLPSVASVATSAPASQPRLRRPSESERTNLPKLWDLTTFDDLQEPGVAAYSISASHRDPHRWSFGWCAQSWQALDTILKPLTLTFLVSEEGISLSNFRIEFQEVGGQKCRVWNTLFTNWDDLDKLILEIHYQLSSDIDDGSSVYTAGEYRHIIILTVR